MPPAKKPAARKTAARKPASRTTTRTASAKTASRREIAAAQQRLEKLLDEAQSALQSVGKDAGRNAQSAYREVTKTLKKLQGDAKKANAGVLKDFDKLKAAVTPDKKPARSTAPKSTAAKSTAAKSTAAKSTAAKTTARKAAPRKASTAKSSTTSRSTSSRSTGTRARTTSRSSS